MLEERPDPANRAQIKAWAGTAKYLDGRIQANPEEKPGRTPDMGPAAAAAMRAVLHEIGSVRGHSGGWEDLEMVLHDHSMFETQADGVAATHSHAAREEAAAKLISNHKNVLNDVTNPSKEYNIIGSPLTQLELQR
eukprot:3299135-Prymnesium_polylepis.1